MVNELSWYSILLLAYACQEPDRSTVVLQKIRVVFLATRDSARTANFILPRYSSGTGWRLNNTSLWPTQSKARPVPSQADDDSRRASSFSQCYSRVLFRIDVALCGLFRCTNEQPPVAVHTKPQVGVCEKAHHMFTIIQCFIMCFIHFSCKTTSTLTAWRA